MLVEQYLVDYLKKYKKLYLPDIGVISYVYKPAEFLSISKTLLPPAYSIQFSQSIDYDNAKNDLVSFIVNNYQLCPDEVNTELDKYFSHFKKQLDLNKSIFIENIGSFKLLKGQVLFNEDKSSILLSFNLGLKEVTICQTDPETKFKSVNTVPSATMHEYRKKKLPKYVFLFIIIILIAGGFFISPMFFDNKYVVNLLTDISKMYKNINIQIPFFYEKDKNRNYEQARIMNREALKINENKSDSAIYAKAPDIKNDTSIYQTSKVEKKLVYYIVAGSYKSKTNAQNHLKQLQLKGFNANIIDLNDTVYRVVIGSSSHRQAAVDEYIRISRTYPDIKIWFFSRYE